MFFLLSLSLSLSHPSPSPPPSRQNACARVSMQQPKNAADLSMELEEGRAKGHFQMTPCARQVAALSAVDNAFVCAEWLTVFVHEPAFFCLYMHIITCNTHTHTHTHTHTNTHTHTHTVIMIMMMMREKETGEGEGKGRKTVGGNKGRPAPTMSIRHLRSVAQAPRVYSFFGKSVSHHHA